MKVLLDTNILIPLEPVGLEDVEQGTDEAVHLLRLLVSNGHQYYIHTDSIREVLGDRNAWRRDIRRQLLEKYPVLVPAPEPSPRLYQVLGRPADGSHNAVDLRLLAALESDAVDILVTNDLGIHRRAAQVGLEDRVFTTPDAVTMACSLFTVTPEPPPAVGHLRAYQLDDNDPIFGSLRNDYPNFDEWLRKCKLEHRDCWVVRAGGRVYGGIAIVKAERPAEYKLGESALKLCTFKIAEQQRRNRLGELLLKAVFQYAYANDHRTIYIEVLPCHEDLKLFLDNFGFHLVEYTSQRGEWVTVKQMKPPAYPDPKMNALDYHVTYGPYCVAYQAASMLIVPIRPEYHRALFPDADAQVEMFPGMRPHGNAIRKAYLCRSAIRKIQPGDVLLFYRTGDLRAVTTVGVVERVLVSSDPSTVARAVAKRTVYTYHEIVSLCKQEVLALLFRQAYVLEKPITYSELGQRGILAAAPQSIVTVPEEAKPWLINRLKPSC